MKIKNTPALVERFNLVFCERYRAVGQWDESKHPRDPKGSSSGGQFTSAESAEETYQTKKGETKTRKAWRLTGGQPLPEHTAGYYIPPGWTDVKISTDPKSSRVATGKDAKGRTQTIYRKEFIQQQATLKFSRVQEGIAKFNAMQEQNARNLQSQDAPTRESAAVMRLIMATGIRPGSDRDTKAEKQAYGATTLLGQHVTQDKSGGVVLRYTGKKGVDLSIPVHDSDVAADLLARKQKAGEGGRLFGVNDSQLRDYSHSLDGGGFKTKDFRTIRGTSEALRLVQGREGRPKSEKERKAWIKEVAVAVSSVLGNTPSIALQSYIDPHVFEPWGLETQHAAA